MPEIKHQFTGGKMNKDLDERLVPNGEYRDALNIEVSTSEASDVGTVQNILGNSLIAGQDFIPINSVCVGSIADEKNDKLYYFVTNTPIPHDGFNAVSNAAWTHSNGVATYDGTAYAWIDINLSGFIEIGHTYKVSFTNTTDSGNPLLAQLGGQNSEHITTEGPQVVYITAGSNYSAGNTANSIRFYAGSTGVRWNGTISDVVIIDQTSHIIEYDSKTNSITPVLVDVIGDVLKFNPDNIITGINIIDDLLLWTDNESEPKKINIQRSIEGTDPSGTLHTNFINSKISPQLEELIKEEHITVIKKAPKSPPTIELTSERFANPDGIYTGVMRITEPPSTPLLQHEPNLDNTSSLWTSAISTRNHYYDFSSLRVGSYFDFQIETDINGDSGFALDWQLYDTVLFREFTGPDYDEPPKIPIVDYRIKAMIVNWTGLGGPNAFTDMDSEVTQNGDFTIPNSSGNKPKYWDWNSSSTSSSTYDNTYDPVNNKIIINHPGDYNKVYNSILGGWVSGAKYKMSVEVSNYVEGKFSFSAAVPASTFGQSGNLYYFRGGGNSGFTDHYEGDGIHEYEFECIESAASGTTSWSGADDKLVVQFYDPTNGVSFKGDINSVKVERLDTPNAKVRCKVLALNNPPTVSEMEGELKFAVDKQNEEEKIFEFKFPRFAYRYQYEDREYSTMSPFSPVAFLPGLFDYHPKKGYNLGMTNRVNEILIKDFTTNVPDGVVAIDILYKDDSSSNIYVVESIKPTSNMWISDEFSITSEQVNQVIPSNQLLRLWDNVPKKALAQDISGNRIIYGNYVQGFDLKNSGNNDYYPLFDFNFQHNSNPDLNPKKSIKSLREYQLGIVFVDEYGRETPVLSSKSGTKKLNKIEADKQNIVEVAFQDQLFPENMKYFKFFIKETSGEYYNLAMDRYYDAEDSNIWLSFPSSDRNKLDEDTFLILKKGPESNQMVTQEARYKIIDIQNEAPDFIKQRKTLVEKKTHEVNVENIFSGLNDAPLVGNDFIKMNYYPFRGSSGSELHDIIDKENSLYIQFTESNSPNASERYRIVEMTNDWIPGQSPMLSDSSYSMKLDKPLGDDVNFIAQGGYQTPTGIKEGTIVNIYKYTIENSPKFDGRFFVKINIDAVFESNLVTEEIADPSYRTVLSRKLYYLSDNVKNLHKSIVTGQDHGIYDDSTYGSSPGFGSFAPFFRNYDGNTLLSTYSGESVAQYKFGYDDANNRKWLQELTWITTADMDRDTSAGNVNKWPGIKMADSHGWGNSDRDGVFNGAEEQEKGEVWFIDDGPFAGGGSGDNLWWHGMTLQASTAHGITEASWWGRMDIGIGGVYNGHEQEGTGTMGGDPEYFNVGGGASGNSNYGGGTQNLVSRIYPGQKFRFREDPSGEIYTIQPSITQRQRLRWKQLAMSSAPSGQPNHGFRSFDWQRTSSQWEYNFPNDSSSSYSTNGTDFEVYATQLSPNFTKNWTPKFINSSGEGYMDWNPTGPPGPIDNGLKLAIDHKNDTITQWQYPNPTPTQPYAVVDSIFATDQVTGKTHAITTGMILTSHSGGSSTNDIYDGTTDEKAPLAIKRIEDTSGNGAGPWKLFLSGYTKFLTNSPITGVAPRHNIFTSRPDDGGEMIFEQPVMNGYSQYSVNRINAQHGGDKDHWGIMAIGYNLEFVEAIEPEPVLPTNPAIWETEPKESTPLDIYYEASGLYPLKLDSDTASGFIPFGSVVEDHHGDGYIEAGTTVDSFTNNLGDWEITFNKSQLVGGQYYTGGISGGHIKITKPNGDAVVVKILGFGTIDSTTNRTFVFKIYPTLYGGQVTYALNWHNCYSFGNGVESNRIRDNFNLPYISNGVKVSTTLEEGLGEEHRKYGLIYSGIYNSNSSTNNLNQFIAAEKITKDINPIYGSIQKLHSRDSDLVTLCEDKCLRIMANKDAVFNADGNTNLTATNRVLGQTIPFSGEFGISKNPESFASESYRVYFTDKVRGTVMRLSKDGLTPISMHGMKDWFKDNLKLSTKLIGSYDDRKDEYNITLKDSRVETFASVEYSQVISTVVGEIESFWYQP